MFCKAFSGFEGGSISRLSTLVSDCDEDWLESNLRFILSHLKKLRYTTVVCNDTGSKRHSLDKLSNDNAF